MRMTIGNVLRFTLQILRLTCTYFDDEYSESDFALCLLVYFDYKHFQYDLKDTLSYWGVEEGNATIQVTWKSNLQYTYNIQPNSVAKSAPRILLKFIVDGPPLLINFINDFITRNEDPNTLYHLLPKTNFTILIEGESFQGIQFVYFKHLNIDVLKLSDLSLQVINGHRATAILILFIRNSVK